MPDDDNEELELSIAVGDPLAALAAARVAHQDEALPEPDEKGLVAARIMGAIYLDLLKSIERARFDVFSRRIRVSRPRQAAIAASTWLKVMAG